MVGPSGVFNRFSGCGGWEDPPRSSKGEGGEPPPLVDPNGGGQSGGQPPCSGGGGGSVGTPTCTPQNDPHDALIIFSIPKCSKKNFQKNLPINPCSHQPKSDPQVE